MKTHILLCLLFLLSVATADLQTTLTYSVEYQDQQEEDYIELGLIVSAQGPSLVKAMDEALKIAEQIKKIATEFCLTHAAKKTDCKDIVEIGNYDIKPKYQVVKRQSTFIGFDVEHQVAIKVIAIDFISDLADRILKERNTKIKSFQWKPLEEVNKEETAVKQGTEQGEGLCEQLGMHLQSIKSVEEMTEEETEQTAVYKFKIVCLPGKPKKVEKQVTKETKADLKEDQAKEEKKAEAKDEKKGKKEKKTVEKKVKKQQEKKPATKPVTAEL